MGNHISGWSGQGLSLLEPGAFNANNQITSSGWNYTEANNLQRGNVTQTPGGATMSYDAENRQIAYNSSGQTTYFYDGAGHRVMSQGASGTAVFVYDASGTLASEFDSQSGGPLCYTCYVTEDHLGSTRVVTSGAADLWPPGCAVFRQDDLPFGEPILTSGGQPRASATGGTVCTANGYLTLSPPLREQFTGQQLNAESNLNFFQARYFAGGAGRFMSPDAAGTFVADPTNPQSWNLYSYAWNNPLAYFDPSGLCSLSPNGDLTDDDKFGGTVIQPGPCLVNGQIGDFGNSGKNSTTVNGGMGGVAGAMLDLALGHPTPTITPAGSGQGNNLRRPQITARPGTSHAQPKLLAVEH